MRILTYVKTATTNTSVCVTLLSVFTKTSIKWIDLGPQPRLGATISMWGQQSLRQMSTINLISQVI